MGAVVIDDGSEFQCEIVNGKKEWWTMHGAGHIDWIYHHSSNSSGSEELISELFGNSK